MGSDVLVVEDNELVREMCEAVLASGGWTVHCASSVDEAVEQLDAHPEVSVLVTDLSLPGERNGLDLIALVRARPAPVRIVLSTGHLERPNELPADVTVLLKPFPVQALLDAVGTEPDPSA
jgi:CheY-like chemotaxis protein